MKEQSKIAAAGCQPMFEFSTGSFTTNNGGSSLANGLGQQPGGYLFETSNIVYVLKGPGQRKSSSLEGISSIC
jgi:hypothetical protein